MSWIMSVAAGVAIGYFIIQLLERRRKGDGFQVSEKLHKSASNRMIAGVCGGIAEYLNADPTVVRLVTVLLMLGWGSGLLAYIVCALIMPEHA